MNNEEQNSTNYHPIQDFYRHQREVLKTHQQYLAQQMEYARAFWQVLQQFSHESDGKLIDLPAGIQQNLQWFHHHQQETLKIHEQYLQGQSEQTQIALQWGINAEGGVPALQGFLPPCFKSKTSPPNALPNFEPPAPNLNPTQLLLYKHLLLHQIQLNQSQHHSLLLQLASQPLQKTKLLSLQRP